MYADQGIRSHPLLCASNMTHSRLCSARLRALILSKRVPKRRRDLSVCIQVGGRASKRGGPPLSPLLGGAVHLSGTCCECPCLVQASSSQPCVSLTPADPNVLMCCNPLDIATRTAATHPLIPLPLLQVTLCRSASTLTATFL